MVDWTKSANEELDRYFARVKANLEGSEADPAEVIEDMRRHVNEEINSLQLKIVTREDIQGITARIGLPEATGTPPPEMVAPEKPKKVTKQSILYRIGTLFIAAFGVFLPIFSLGFEVTTGWGAMILFDSLPTIFHVLLAAIVPIVNYLTWRVIKKEKTKSYSKLSLANGFVLGIAIYYTLLFIPVTPIAVVGILYVGLGLLPLTPILALGATILLRRRLTRVFAGQRYGRYMWVGILIAFVVLIGLEIPKTVTRISLKMALSPAPVTRLRGIKILRFIKDDELLLRHCYQRQGQTLDLISFLTKDWRPVTTSEAREIYYRVTGIPFNAVPPPELANGFGRADNWDDFVFDADQGGVAVGGRLQGLSLTGSRFDGSLDPDASLAYLEWTMVFQNESQRQREARAQILLPPGAVVSRLTLWVDGEEREAAFAARAKVQEAYQSIVRRQRDPVLVTTRGPDRIQVQCFPVPENGGEMKIRIGITVPLILENPNETLLRLPSFLERNFNIAEETTHLVWIESKKPFLNEGPLWQTENPETELYAVRGGLQDIELAAAVNSIRGKRTVDALESWSDDPVYGDTWLIRQTIAEESVTAPARVVMVVDGSQQMESYLPEIAAALPQLPPGIEFSLLLASDEVQQLSGPVQTGTAQLYAEVAQRLRDVEAAGGCDNVPALAAGWDLAAAQPNSMILWIHGPQPVKLQTLESILQRWERRPDNPRLCEVSVGVGANRIIEEFDGIQPVTSLPRLRRLEEDLLRLFSLWRGEKKQIIMQRERWALTEPLPENVIKTSDHLARLWAYSQVMHYFGIKETQDAIRIAASYQLVTPVTGAVVLETQQQYDDAGLEAVDPNTVPTIPEPEFWVLLTIVLFVLMWVLYRKKRVAAKCR